MGGFSPLTPLQNGGLTMVEPHVVGPKTPSLVGFIRPKYRGPTGPLRCRVAHRRDFLAVIGWGANDDGALICYSYLNLLILKPNDNMCIIHIYIYTYIYIHDFRYNCWLIYVAVHKQNASLCACVCVCVIVFVLRYLRLAMLCHRWLDSGCTHADFTNIQPS